MTPPAGARSACCSFLWRSARGRLRAGETLLMRGAIGNFGSAAVAVVLAMGACCFLAAGRNEAVLADLTRRFGERLRPAAVA